MKRFSIPSFKKMECVSLIYHAIALIVPMCKGTLSSTDVAHGERYSDPIVLAIDTVGQQQCMKECLSRPALCGGVNYKKENLLCELVNSIDKTEADLDYIRIGVNDAMAIDGCRSCVVDQRCVILSSNRSYCVKDNYNMNDCALLHNSSSDLPSGLYRIHIPVLGHVNVFCEMEEDGGGWTVFQRRMDGSEDFYRTWRDYKNGFGNLTSEFWLGNDKLYYLLSQGAYEMRMDMSDFDNETRYVKYRSIAIGNETTKYVMSISGYSGDIGDCFTQTKLPIHGMKFTTKDQDNDADGSRNCAIAFNSGWWHRNCHCGNPNGLYLRGPTTQYGKGITYHPFKGHIYSLKTMQLMVRRVG